MATKAKRREFDQVLTFQGRNGTSFLTVDDEKRVDDATRVGVRVKLVPAGRLKAFRAKSRDWASTTLEDGRLLAVSLVPRHFSDETRIEKIPDRLDAFGIEEGELLLDGDREVLGRIEPLAGLRENPVVRHAIGRVAHEAGRLDEARRGQRRRDHVAARHWASSRSRRAVG